MMVQQSLKNVVRVWGLRFGGFEVGSSLITLDTSNTRLQRPLAKIHTG